MELSLLEVLSDAYGHALAAFQSEARRGLPALSTKKRRTVGLTVAATLLALLLLVRIPESVLAPAEIVPRDPLIVSSPVKGQIRDTTWHSFRSFRRIP